MTHSRDDLVALLHDLADADPARPIDAGTGVARRIARRRRRRTALAASAIVVVLATAAVLVQLARRPTAPAPADLPLPARVFVDNGVTYTRVTVAYLDTSDEQSVTVSIPPGDDPVAVFASCRLADRRGTRISAVRLDTVAGYAASLDAFSCADGGPRATQVGRDALPDGGTRMRFAVADSYADTPADAAASWAFAVYTAGVPVPAASQPAPPEQIIVAGSPADGLTSGVYTRVSTYSGFWPAARSVSVVIPYGTPSVLMFQCPAPLAGQPMRLPGVTDSTYVNGGSLSCLHADHPPTDTDFLGAGVVAQLGDQRPPPANTSTQTTFTLTLDPSDQTHPGFWTIGIYQLAIPAG